MSNGHSLADEPPPAYELSQQEFDQKTSLALEASVSISDNAVDGGAFTGDGDNEEWEVWDEPSFEAACARHVGNANASGSSLIGARGPLHPTPVRSEEGVHEHLVNPSNPSPVAPLRVAKKKVYTASEEKRRMANNLRTYPEEEDVSAPSYFESQAESSTSSSQSTSATSRYLIVHNSTEPLHPLSEDEDEDASPPPFAHMAPSMGRPSFEQAVASWGGSDSRLSSPLSSSEHHYPTDMRSFAQLRPATASTASTQSMSPPPGPQPHRPSLPPPRKHNISVAPRPSTSPSPRPTITTSYSAPAKTSRNHRISHMEFDPSVAYTKNTFGNLPVDEEPAVNAAALYKSSVAAHLPTLSQAPSSALHSMNKPLPRRLRPASSSSYGQLADFQLSKAPQIPSRPQGAMNTQPTISSQRHLSFSSSVSPPPSISFNQFAYGQPHVQESELQLQNPAPVVGGINGWSVAELDRNLDIRYGRS